MSLNRVLIAVCEDDKTLNNITASKLMQSIGEDNRAKLEVNDSKNSLWDVHIFTLDEFVRLQNNNNFVLTESDYIRTIQYKAKETITYEVVII